MNYIKEFYQSLDAVNLFLFWGVILVVLLLLIFAIIITNKNRKLKQIIIEKELELDDTKNELAIKTEHNSIETNKQLTNKNEFIIDKHSQENRVVPIVDGEIANAGIKNITNNLKETKDVTIIDNSKEFNRPIIEENHFVAEEHVMEYNQNLFSVPNIKKINENNQIENENNTKNQLLRVPYQKNILKEMSLNQTSPIGIVKKNSNIDEKDLKARELHSALNTENNYYNNLEVVNNLQKETNYKVDNSINSPKSNYLKEISEKMASENTDNILRTSYELRQEEEAVISYKELMKKKDNLKTEDEEEAVISIQELLHKKELEDKLYNITSEEANDKFISELKHFRSDL